MAELSRCAIHTITNKPWTLARCIDAYAKAGVKGIGVWRDVLEKTGVSAARRMLRDAGLSVPSLVRGGFFTATDAAGRRKALDDNRACIDQACAIGAEMVVLVVGATPGIALEDARKHVTEGISQILPAAQAAKVKLAVEPLHPMYAADRSCINRMAEARKICETLNHPMLGIAVDAYHVWWDPDLEAEIALAAKQKTLLAYHVSDWRLSTRHLLTDRGLMGQGVIDLKRIGGWVQRAGFTGFIEVEIFSEEFWAMDQKRYLEMICQAFVQNT
jgi:sugar phosphate isomerase/epimerase